MSDQATAWARSVRVGGSSKKLVLLVLANHADPQGFVSEHCTQAEIATESELSERQVRRILRELSPWFERGRRPGEGGGRQSDTFRLKMREVPVILGARRRQPDNLSAQATGQIEQGNRTFAGGQPDTGGRLTATGHSPHTPLVFSPSKRTPKGVPKGSPAPEPFEQLWAMWRERDAIRRAKRKPALEAFQRLTRAGADPARILAGARAYLQSPEKTADGGKFMPDLFRWLRDEVWADWASEAAPSQQIDWAKREAWFRERGEWLERWGPRPDSPDYRGAAA